MIYPKQMTAKVGFTQMNYYILFQRQHLWFPQTPKELKCGTGAF